MAVKGGAVAVAVTAMVLGAPAAASAANVDLDIISVEPTRTTVPVGVPTAVTFVLNVRNLGDDTTADNTSIGPVGGGSVFENIRMATPAPGTCGPAGGDAPRCSAPFFQRPFTQAVEVTDRVTATETGALTREFTADVLDPDTEGNGDNNTASATIEAVPAPRALSKVAVRPASRLTARQRRRAVAKLKFTAGAAGDLSVTVERKRRSGRFKRWGAFDHAVRAGSNSVLIPRRVILKTERPLNATLHRMRPGAYRLTIRVTDADGNRSKPVRRRFRVSR